MNFLRTKHLIAIAGIACLLVMGNQAFAHENAIDVVPAATLLLPYFEVDIPNPQGITTLFSVNNASAAPQLAHITLWTDMSRPTLDFTIYLTGYDVQTINLGPLFRTGDLPLFEGPRLPVDGSDPPPSNSGPNGSQGSGVFSEDTGDAVDAGETAPCSFPLPTNIGASFLNFIQQVHTGNAIPLDFTAVPNQCIATVGGGLGQSSLGVQDNIARGYLTVDVVRDCSQFVVTQDQYFDVALSTGPDANVLWGDFFLVEPGEDFAQGETLVHIETYGRHHELVRRGLGNDFFYTFYGRYTPGTPWSGQDNREPLATVWGVRYLAGGLFTGGTDLLCWRDVGNDIVTPFSCTPAAARIDPSGQPLSQNQVVIFDEEENPTVITGSPFSPPQQQAALVVCPWEAQRTAVDGPRLPVGPSFGWLYLNLNTDLTAQPEFEDITAGPIHQSWVGVIMSASGRFSVGFEGVAFDHATDPHNLCLGRDQGIGPDAENTYAPPCNRP